MLLKIKAIYASEYNYNSQNISKLIRYRSADAKSAMCLFGCVEKLIIKAENLARHVLLTLRLILMNGEVAIFSRM